MSAKYDVVATVGQYEKDGQVKYLNRKVGVIVSTQKGYRLNSMPALTRQVARSDLTMARYGLRCSSRKRRSNSSRAHLDKLRLTTVSTTISRSKSTSYSKLKALNRAFSFARRKPWKPTFPRF